MSYGLLYVVVILALVVAGVGFLGLAFDFHGYLRLFDTYLLGVDLPYLTPIFFFAGCENFAVACWFWRDYHECLQKAENQRSLSDYVT